MPKPEDCAACTVQDLVIALTKSVDEGFASTRKGLALVTDEIAIVKARQDMNEKKTTDIDARVERISLRAADIDGRTSVADATHDAKIAATATAHAELVTRFDTLDEKQNAQLAILGRLDKLASNPSVKVILTIVATVLATWAASKGLVLK